MPAKYEQIKLGKSLNEVISEHKIATAIVDAIIASKFPEKFKQYEDKILFLEAEIDINKNICVSSCNSP